MLQVWFFDADTQVFIAKNW